jgi:hypothetical protein
MIRQIHFRALRWHQERARNLKKKIADEKHTCTEADDSVVKAMQVARHRELRHRYVLSIHIGDQVADEQKRKQPPEGFPAGRVKRRRSDWWEHKRDGENPVPCRGEKRWVNGSTQTMELARGIEPGTSLGQDLLLPYITRSDC